MTDKNEQDYLFSYSSHGDMICAPRKNWKHPAGLQTNTVQRSKHFSSVNIINLFVAQKSSFKDSMFKHVSMWGEGVCACVSVSPYGGKGTR